MHVGSKDREMLELTGGSKGRDRDRQVAITMEFKQDKKVGERVEETVEVEVVTYQKPYWIWTSRFECFSVR